MEGDKPENTVGAVRTLTFKDGATLKEDLEQYDAASHSYTYHILGEDHGLLNYHATISLVATSDNTTKLTWTAKFQTVKEYRNRQQTMIEGVFKSGHESIAAKLA